MTKHRVSDSGFEKAAKCNINKGLQNIVEIQFGKKGELFEDASLC